MPLLYGLTGTPGTGKKSVARALARRTGWNLLHLNTLAVRGHAIIGRDAHGFIADPQKVRRALRSRLASGPVLVVGHFLPSVLRREEVQFVAVLRCSPDELTRRLGKRCYPPEKVKQNVQAEILDLPLYEAVQTFGKAKVAEFDTTRRQTNEVADEILATIQERRPRRLGVVNWLSNLQVQGKLAQYLD